MKAYGVDKKDANCCPGHDKYSGRKTRSKNLSRKKNEDRPRKKAARQKGKKFIHFHNQDV